MTSPFHRVKGILPVDKNDVEYTMSKQPVDPYVFMRSLADAEANLKDKQTALMEELMRRALAQNPDLANQLRSVEKEKERVFDLRRKDRIARYAKWKAKQDAEHVANRKLKYDDKRNYNKLNAVRRDSYYKSLSRLEQIEREIDEYWKPYKQEMPAALQAEYDELRGINNTTSLAS